MVSSGRSSLTLEEILQRVSEFQIVSYYLGISEIPCVISSPLRKDSHPSFGLYASKDKVRFKDYSTHETGGLIDLLSMMWGTGYQETVARLGKDLSLFKGNVSVHQSQQSGYDRDDSTISDIQVKTREWKDHDIRYWRSYGITLKMLKYAEVYPISHKMITKDGKRYTFGAERYAYVYVERKDGKVTLKVYQPYSKEHKWSTKTDRSVWSLWAKIPERGEYLFISSSVKDCLNLWCNLKIPAVCMQGEGYLPKPKVIDELKGRFNHIIVFYDNDFSKPGNPGRTDSLNLCRTYGLERMEIPEGYGCKDPSDLYLKYGKREYLKIIRRLFDEREQQQEGDKHRSQGI